ncbi:hypothetical protein ACDY96_08315 [Rhizobium mongolense]|uniref:hypothetical protein n=1 Tax=Rhizobium TaxID=379 RepID=UPI0024B170AC|nr:hypothetical protein [Rhizobium sp. CC1099]WFU88870.1 hypothetical protein QA644_07390 [Rhizobium sp. CC1099]
MVMSMNDRDGALAAFLADRLCANTNTATGAFGAAFPDVDFSDVFDQLQDNPDTPDYRCRWLAALYADLERSMFQDALERFGSMTRFEFLEARDQAFSLIEDDGWLNGKPTTLKTIQ